jgi:hypothetical protein
MSDVIKAEIDELAARARAFGIVGGDTITHLNEARLRWLLSETLEAEHYIARATNAMLQELTRK